MAATDTTAPAAGHRRNRSAAAIKSFMHMRSPSEGAALGRNPHPDSTLAAAANYQTPLLPPDHPHGQLRTAGRMETRLDEPPSPQKARDVNSSPKKSLHKKTLSSVSLRSLAKKDEKTKDKQSADARKSREQDQRVDKPKKTKSSTNLAAMFGKGRRDRSPVKDQRERSPVKEQKDKENTTPPTSSNAPAPTRTPIWAEFSSQEITNTSRVPLNDARLSVEEEMARYNPQNYSPSKQRNFFDIGQPLLQQRPTAKERPKSMVVPKATSSSIMETFSRKKSNERVPLSDTKGNGTRTREPSPSKSMPARPGLGRASTDTGRDHAPVRPQAQPTATTKKPNRVMAAVAAFNGKSKTGGTALTSPTKLDPSAIDADFEEVLEARNIPTHQRAQMRTLKLEVKADFVRMHKLDTPAASRAPSAQSSIGEATRPTGSRDGSIEEGRDTSERPGSGNSAKRERPRSRTFTFSRSDSPTKKQKGELNERKTSAKANPIPKSPSSRSLVSNASDRCVPNGAKAVKVDEFITYLKKTPQPQKVEVGKLHKLRLLIRNETLDWVNNFVEAGGMTELVSLLHRIMEIEWREDHEDTLLHELLRCLKGLCTADSALDQLNKISSTLYPALLAMLFDEEHKGPSGFTTRELILDILFAHVSMARDEDKAPRAEELLKYLKDPVKEKETSTVPFVLQMHQPRPYQVWCKEMSNVTKEVFWIFIHHLNVIPVPPQSTSDLPTAYLKRHFPGPRAIVPAAPYVGGVEWDATNYLATHIDLMNGILASLPTRTARNTVREELKVSGFEKLMGHLRACNPKYYGAVHDSVKVWIGAALEDDWDVKTVRMGSGDGKGSVSPLKQSPAKKVEKPPQLQPPPKIDYGLGLGLGFDKEISISGVGKKDDDWI